MHFLFECSPYPSYVEPVPGTPYTVGAGVYDDTRSIADLEKMSGG